MKPHRREPNLRFALFLSAMCLGILSCHKDTFLQNEHEGKTELALFLSNTVAKLGGAPLSLNRKTYPTLHYLYSVDENGTQVVCLGNRINDMLNIFQPSYGEPKLMMTNKYGFPSFVYAVNQVNVAINCGLDAATVGGTNLQFTHLVIVRAGAIKF